MNKRYLIYFGKSLLFLCVFFDGIVESQKTYVFKEFPYKESNKNVCTCILKKILVIINGTLGFLFY